MESPAPLETLNCSTNC